jgi:alpha-1,3-mannosyltransferase
MTDNAKCGDAAATRQIGRVRVEVSDRPAALSWVSKHIRSGRAQLVSFCNAHTVNLAARDDRFAAALQSFLMLNDGIGVDLASRVLYGEAFPCNLAGTDFVPALLDFAQPGLRIFLLGSASGVAEQAAEQLHKRYPRHHIVGTHPGFFQESKSSEVAAEIRASSSNLILVGMGQPRQELWSFEYLRDIPAVTMCVGALLDFTAGRVQRAPPWIRAARLEWLYRLALEPRRLGGRYLVGNVLFLARVLRDRVRRPRSAPSEFRR